MANPYNVIDKIKNDNIIDIERNYLWSGHFENVTA